MNITEKELDLILKALAYCAVKQDSKFSVICAELHNKLFVYREKKEGEINATSH